MTPIAATIFATLDALATKRLFYGDKWLVDSSTADALCATLLQLGVVENVPNQAKTTHYTSVGKDLKVDLQEVFMGLCDPWDAVSILEDYDLVAEDELELLYALLAKGEKYFEPMLRVRVQQAYRDYYNAKYPN
jgi:hypothetical protein